MEFIKINLGHGIITIINDDYIIFAGFINALENFDQKLTKLEKKINDI